MIKKNLIIAGAILLAAASLLVYQEYARADISSNLVGHWKLDEGTASTTADSIGTANGSWTTNSPTWVTGHIGPYALQSLTGTSYVDMGAWTLFNSVSAATVSLWVNLVSTHNGNIISLGSSLSGNGMRMYDQASANTLLCSFWTNTSGAEIRASWNYGLGSEPSGWHLLSCTYDGTNVTLYLDGAQKATAADTGASTMKNATHNLYLFLDQADFQNGYYGSIDDVCLYTRTLSGTELTALYNSTTGCTASAPASTPPVPKVEIEAPMSLQAPAIIQ